MANDRPRIDALSLALLWTVVRKIDAQVVLLAPGMDDELPAANVRRNLDRIQGNGGLNGWGCLTVPDIQSVRSCMVRMEGIGCRTLRRLVRIWDGTDKDKHADCIEGLRPYAEWFNRFAMIEPMVLCEMNPLSEGRRSNLLINI